MTLTATEFLRRFLMHVLPKGFVRFRSRSVHIRSAAADTTQRHESSRIMVERHVNCGNEMETDGASAPRPTPPVRRVQESRSPAWGTE